MALEANKFPPQAAMTLEALGLNSITTVRSASGLDQKNFLAKTHVAIDGAPQGLLRFSTIEPLSAADLATIPANADVALAVKINPLAVFDAYTDMLGKMDPRRKDMELRDIGQMESQLQLKLRDDILKPLGDRLCLWVSLGTGGPPAVTAVLQVKDSPTAARSFAKLMQFVEAISKAQQARFPAHRNRQG